MPEKTAAAKAEGRSDGVQKNAAGPAKQEAAAKVTDNDESSEYETDSDAGSAEEAAAKSATSKPAPNAGTPGSKDAVAAGKAAANDATKSDAASKPAPNAGTTPGSKDAVAAGKAPTKDATKSDAASKPAPNAGTTPGSKDAVAAGKAPTKDATKSDAASAKTGGTTSPGKAGVDAADDSEESEEEKEKAAAPKKPTSPGKAGADAADDSKEEKEKTAAAKKPADARPTKDAPGSTTRVVEKADSRAGSKDADKAMKQKARAELAKLGRDSTDSEALPGLVKPKAKAATATKEAEAVWTLKCKCGKNDVTIYGNLTYPNGNLCCCNDCRQTAQWIEKEGGRKEIKAPAAAGWFPNDLRVIKSDFRFFKLRTDSTTTKVMCKSCKDLLWVDKAQYGGAVVGIYYKMNELQPKLDDTQAPAVFCTAEYPYGPVPMPKGKVDFQCERFTKDGRSVPGLMEYQKPAFGKKIEDPKGDTNSLKIIEKNKGAVEILGLPPLLDFEDTGKAKTAPVEVEAKPAAAAAAAAAGGSQRQPSPAAASRGEPAAKQDDSDAELPTGSPDRRPPPAASSKDGDKAAAAAASPRSPLKSEASAAAKSAGAPGFDPPSRRPSGTTPAAAAARSVSPAPATPKATPAASPKPTPAASPKATPASSPKATPAASPKPTPAASPKATPASSPKATPAASPKPTPAASPKATPASSPKATPAASPKPALAATAPAVSSVPGTPRSVKSVAASTAGTNAGPFKTFSMKSRKTRLKAGKLAGVEISEEDQEILRDVFGTITRGSARMRGTDVGNFVERLGGSPDSQALVELLREQSQSDIDSLTKADFIDWAGGYLQQNDPHEELVEIWRLAGGGRSGAGMVTHMDLQRLLDQFGLHMSSEEMTEFCRGHEAVNYDLFVSMLMEDKYA
eukprot:TRINITY_DN5750_c0_g1_i1.p1 TRINITY_DN5750_c0_g1~~TRINITY_DN5750_c0_g1_i1.p1  ORF type:complete len:908 (-),score=251.01 TRINITY_DN5750_c0_g1_i1:87-2810(-)